MKCQRIRREKYRQLKQLKQGEQKVLLDKDKQEKKNQLEQNIMNNKKYNNDIQKAIKSSLEDKKKDDKEKEDIEKAIKENNIINNSSITIGDIDSQLHNMLQDLHIDEYDNKTKVITSRKRERQKDDNLYDNSDNKKKQHLSVYDENKNHIDFIIGRGKLELSGGLNIPINPVFNKRNIII